MAKFRLTAKKDIHGGGKWNVNAGDMVVIDVPHVSWINTQIVREAFETQLGKRMNCGYDRDLFILTELS